MMFFFSLLHMYIFKENKHYRAYLQLSDFSPCNSFFSMSGRMSSTTPYMCLLPWLKTVKGRGCRQSVKVGLGAQLETLQICRVEDSVVDGRHHSPECSSSTSPVAPPIARRARTSPEVDSSSQRFRLFGTVFRMLEKGKILVVCFQQDNLFMSNKLY